MCVYGIFCNRFQQKTKQTKLKECKSNLYEAFYTSKQKNYTTLNNKDAVRSIFFMNMRLFIQKLHTNMKSERISHTHIHNGFSAAILLGMFFFFCVCHTFFCVFSMFGIFPVYSSRYVNMWYVLCWHIAIYMCNCQLQFGCANVFFCVSLLFTVTENLNCILGIPHTIEL